MPYLTQPRARSPMSSYDDDLYGTLGVAADATAQSIRDAYNKKAQRFHPDAATSTTGRRFSVV